MGMCSTISLEIIFGDRIRSAKGFGGSKKEKGGSRIEQGELSDPTADLIVFFFFFQPNRVP